jgi:hypothetical protein
MYLFQTLLSFAVAFGLHLSTAQIAATNAVVAAILSFITRSLVTPVANPRTAQGEPATLVPAASPTVAMQG